ncbi:zinc finger protein 62 [Biomphalaria glabrata]|nr:zinc finger protein 62 [Biomphalaria glabrata]
MMKEVLDPLNTKCSICWQILRPKSPLLHGTKCSKYKIKEKLQFLLPPQDFKTLVDENIFSSPRLCNVCFITINKICKTISKANSLIGKNINIRLYKPYRSEWKSDLTDTNSHMNDLFNKKSHLNKLQQPLSREHDSSCLLVNATISEQRDDECSCGKVSSNSVEETKVGSSNSFFHSPTLERSDTALDDIITGEQEISTVSEEDPHLPHSSSAQFDIHNSENKRSKVLLPLQERRKRNSSRNQALSANIKVQPSRESKRASALKSRNRKLSSEIKANSDLEPLSDISNVESGDEHIPLSEKQVKRSKVEGDKKCNSSKKRPNFKSNTKFTQLKRKESKFRKSTSRQTANDELRKEAEDGLKVDKANGLRKVPDDALSVCWEASFKTDIPKGLSKMSKSKLLKLATKLSKITADKKSPLKTVLIKCSMNNCDHSYTCWSDLAVHLKYYHFNGEPTGKDDFTLVLFSLTDNGELSLEEYPYRCGRRGCSLAFSQQDFLQEHQLVHGSDLKYICGYPDCVEAFKEPRDLSEHLKSHAPMQHSTSDVLKSGKNSTETKVKTPHKKTKEMNQTEHKSQHTGGKHQILEPINTETFPCDLCGKLFLNDVGLTGHKRKVHSIGKPGLHKCPYNGCQESFVKKEKLEIHMCSHSAERQLFCEKCGKKFSCQRYLDVHYKIHLKNEKHASQPPARDIPCEFTGCTKMFTSRENMKSHVLNQHRGRKPKSIPGVFFSCSVEGCGKKFSFRSTLYRHNKLVHRGGDYKQGSEYVKYPCTYEGCSVEFNRKNLLEEHMVMEHGKLPKRLLPLQNKELDFIEGICSHCGMVLTVTLLPRHEEIYHSLEALKESKESSPYPCHLKGCEELFNVLEDRKAHVQLHINNPPYKCQVGDCRETFYLEKNLDNHLWNHSKKQSKCDFVDCGQVFDDQLQLAKHSKVHYDNKMKCPWPNCDIWLTETGHLKPHFIAHSRSLMANFDLDFVCEICELAFSSKWGLMIHKRMHGEDAAAKPCLSRLTKFRCEESGCEGTFADQKGFFDHFLYHYTNIPARCDFNGCSETFRNMITMSRHTKQHYDGKFKCPWQSCEKLFASVFIVKKHLYRHISSNPDVSVDKHLSCNQCFMTFKFQENLESHFEHHKEKSDHVCPTCGKKGRHNHIKAQKQGKPRKSQVCSECKACYATVSGLKLHLLQKHKIGKWPFQCNYCGKGFVSSREMQRHIPSHTKEKPFVCNICGTSFASHTGHRAHVRKHAGQKYECDVEGCGKVYTTAISLRGHKAQHEGFSKTCPYCGKTYKNPYGHKCKASRDNKKKILRPAGSSQTTRSNLSQPVTLLPQTVQQSLPPTPHPPPQQSVLQVQAPATTQVQHTLIMPQHLVTHNMDMHQTARPIMAPDTLSHSHIMQHSLNPVMPQCMPQGHHHLLPHQNLMQERSGVIPMDITRGNTMDMTGGDYTFNNYVVFWDSQNLQ